jgi:hypothetical protein
MAQRNCGVWVVDTRTSQTIAFLRFEDAIQEVFSIQVLAGLRYPEIAQDDSSILGDCFDFAGEMPGDVACR